jgi:hypothetical protein
VSAFLLCIASVARTADEATLATESPLVKLALAKFHSLTRAERALLEFADKSNIGRANFAMAGTSAAPLDPSNDPKNAAAWPHDRDIRAQLIRWMAVDNEATLQVDPNGVRVVGARIVGGLDLDHVRVPFAMTLERCSIPDAMSLVSSEFPSLDLSGSYTGPIEGENLITHGDLNFGSAALNQGAELNQGEFSASGFVNLQFAKIEGLASFSGGHFRYSESNPWWTKPLRMALSLSNSEIKADVGLSLGFESDGCVFMPESVIGGDVNGYGGRFINPGNDALDGSGSVIKGGVVLGGNPMGFGGDFTADGIVSFANARVGSIFLVEGARFEGKATEHHGFYATGLLAPSEFVWQNVSFENGAFADLSGAHIGNLFDEEKSWPAPGNLLIDGLTYDTLGGFSSFDPQWKWSSPADASARLRWLGLQNGFHSQPYRQLAQVLRKNGDEAGATEVLIAQQDARFSNSNLLGRVWAQFLKITIGYGHKPLRTILWSLAVILTGWLIVTLGARAGVMRATWPDSPPASEVIAYEKLHPLLYSLDVFLPFVNLHQEHYWWPDAERSGDCTMFGAKLRISGAFLRYYLWSQVIAGWLLSAIFVAGVTGLMRND